MDEENVRYAKSTEVSPPRWSEMREDFEKLVHTLVASAAAKEPLTVPHFCVVEATLSYMEKLLQFGFDSIYRDEQGVLRIREFDNVVDTIASNAYANSQRWYTRRTVLIEYCTSAILGQEVYEV